MKQTTAIYGEIQIIGVYFSIKHHHHHKDRLKYIILFLENGNQVARS